MKKYKYINSSSYDLLFTPGNNYKSIKEEGNKITIETDYENDFEIFQLEEFNTLFQLTEIED